MEEQYLHGHRIEGLETLAEAATLRVRVLTLGPGQSVPWHHHTQITDRFFCMSGQMCVNTRTPENGYRLDPGETCTVPPEMPHHVHGADEGPCKFLIVQGIGLYDFVPDED